MFNRHFFAKQCFGCAYKSVDIKSEIYLKGF